MSEFVIRLKRQGAHKNPLYFVIVTKKHMRSNTGKVLERFGIFTPTYPVCSGYGFSLVENVFIKEVSFKKIFFLNYKRLAYWLMYFNAKLSYRVGKLCADGFYWLKESFCFYKKFKEDLFLSGFFWNYYFFWYYKKQNLFVNYKKYMLFLLKRKMEIGLILWNYNNVPKKINSLENLMELRQANTYEDFKYIFYKKFNKFFIERYEDLKLDKKFGSRKMLDIIKILVKKLRKGLFVKKYFFLKNLKENKYREFLFKYLLNNWGVGIFCGRTQLNNILYFLDNTIKYICKNNWSICCKKILRRNYKKLLVNKKKNLFLKTRLFNLIFLDLQKNILYLQIYETFLFVWKYFTNGETKISLSSLYLWIKYLDVLKKKFLNFKKMNIVGIEFGNNNEYEVSQIDNKFDFFSKFEKKHFLLKNKKENLFSFNKQQKKFYSENSQKMVNESYTEKFNLVKSLFEKKEVFKSNFLLIVIEKSNIFLRRKIKWLTSFLSSLRSIKKRHWFLENKFWLLNNIKPSQGSQLTSTFVKFVNNRNRRKLTRGGRFRAGMFIRYTKPLNFRKFLEQYYLFTSKKLIFNNFLQMYNKNHLFWRIYYRFRSLRFRRHFFPIEDYFKDVYYSFINLFPYHFSFCEYFIKMSSLTTNVEYKYESVQEYLHRNEKKRIRKRFFRRKWKKKYI